MQHQERAGKLEVDHFDPGRKKDLFQDYENLLPASRHCNSKKSDNWPTVVERAAGIRFLNPCSEIDYGEQIFEDPQSHLLRGVNPAAIWHIRMCGLNADHLVNERKKRAGHWKLLKEKSIRIKSNLESVSELISRFKAEVEIMIPPIPSE
jgi:hypothetical protein